MFKEAMFQNLPDTPLYSAIKEYAGSDLSPFHTPGHKMGTGLPTEFLNNLATIDITEIPGMDNLHRPTGIIGKAQELAAEAFLSDRTWFLVNGSTCGILAAVSAVCHPGSRLAVGRNCHYSVINAMVAAGVEPVYVLPEYNSNFAITAETTPSSIAQVLEKNPDIEAVLITSPNYYGICCNLREIADIVHNCGKVLIVDEAHGAHLCFSEDLPESAMQSGADICVQSAHKTLPALTQSAMLHIREGRVDTEKLEFYLKLFQTSSPSYILMASLDICRAIMQKYGNALLNRLILSIDHSRGKFAHKNLLFLGTEGSNAVHDNTRIVLNTAKLGITGSEADESLRVDWGIQIEMHDAFNIVCIATPADNENSIEKLFSAFRGLALRSEGKEPLIMPQNRFAEIPKQEMLLGSIKTASIEKRDIRSAKNRICADIVAPYPPGIPVLCPGELITDSIVKSLVSAAQRGFVVHGLDESLGVKIFK